jgi:hypothetical protein
MIWQIKSNKGFLVAHNVTENRCDRVSEAGQTSLRLDDCGFRMIESKEHG